MGGRPRGFDTETYRGRNVVERFNRLKNWRGIATLAAALIWIKSTV